jgi:ubiquinone/menaquinone biosynthesis C-methylase UbiE
VRVDKLPRHDDIHEQPAGLEPPLEADAGQQRLVSRVLEPEVMESFEEAWAYDQMDHAAVNRKFVDDLIAGGEVKGDIVDLGTGTALIPIELCQRVPGIRVMAIDASGAMLDLANRHLEIERLKDRIFLQQADCKGLKGFASGMADTVISNSLIHHLPDPYAAVGEAVRLLRPRGRLFVRDLVRPATQGEVDRLVDLYAGGEPGTGPLTAGSSLDAGPRASSCKPTSTFSARSSNRASTVAIAPGPGHAASSAANCGLTSKPVSRC